MAISPIDNAPFLYDPDGLIEFKDYADKLKWFSFVKGLDSASS